MEIKVEVSLTPEELRRFLGLPDVGGLQDDLIDFLRDKMGAASSAAGDFDASGFVKANFDSLRKAPGKGFSTLLKRVHLTEAAKETESPTPRTRPKTRGKAGAAGAPRTRRPTKKKTP